MLEYSLAGGDSRDPLRRTVPSSGGLEWWGRVKSIASVGIEGLDTMKSIRRLSDKQWEDPRAGYQLCQSKE